MELYWKASLPSHGKHDTPISDTVGSSTGMVAASRQFLLHSAGMGAHAHAAAMQCAGSKQVAPCLHACRVKYTDVPGRGLLATVSTEDKAFECHITLSKVARAFIHDGRGQPGAQS